MVGCSPPNDVCQGGLKSALFGRLEWGRKLGFPTANVALPPDDELAYGRYAARTELPDGGTFPFVVSIGVRPYA